MKHNILSLDFWQDTVTYAGSVMPTGTIGCAVLNIPDETITRLDAPCMILNQLLTGIGLKNVDMQLLPKAQEAGLDLVKIAPQAKPPVCRIMDYGKFKYDQAIKAKQARKNQSKIETKEMKFRPKIDVGDYTTKKKHVIRFLEAGSKVKITIMFRGREMSHPEQGLSILERLADDLKDVAVIENQPKMEGRNMHMLIAPLPTTVKKKKDEQGKDN